VSEAERWIFGLKSISAWRRRGSDDLPPYQPPVDPPPPPPDPPPTDPGTPLPPNPPPLPPTSVTNPELPFELEPLRAAMAASSLEVYAHWFPPYPISLNNALPKALGGAGDTYDVTFLDPAGSAGAYASVGGFLRDRPIPRKPLTGDYVLQDCLTDIARAKRMGVDGFTVEGLGFGTSANWARIKSMITACEQVNDPNFKLIYMPDGGGNATADPVALGNEMAGILKSPAFKRLPDGRVIVAPFAPESAPAGARTWGAAGWQQAADQCKAAGGPSIAWWFCYVAQWTGTTGTFGTAGYVPAAADKYNAMAYGHGRWGDRDEGSNRANSINAGQASATCLARYGKPFMEWASPQDTRPNANNHKYWEAKNTGAWRACWDRIIATKPGVVQIPTWNDFSESAHVSPSPLHGWAWADIGSFYMARAKLGYWPSVTRDAIYLSHRIHPATGTTFTGGQTLFQTLQAAGTTPAVNDVEALCFLTSNAGTTVKVTSGGITTSFDAATATAVAPGVYSFKVPLRNGAAGSIKAEVVRGGVAVATVSSKFAVSSTQPREDLQYRVTGSLPAGTRP
jgi:Glycosyl hydrolase family 71